MKLSKLEIFGFKSFLNRTVFQFDEGVTSIVGPNGCGKSNVVDAIIWALGERGTKSLRVKDMGDVIFHGSNGKRPVNIAEVAIQFLDGNGVETAIKRRIYRDGSNDYILNGKSVRLKDIQDNLMGTGIGMNSYAIIEQGKIEYFIQMKSQERKVVIEETSGVTRFEEKKREATGRLEEVRTNLERIEDIYREVIKSFEKTEQEWQRWKEHKVLADQLSEVDKWILLDGHSRLLKRIVKVRERAADLEQEMALKEEERQRLREEKETKEKEFSLIDTATRQIEVDIKGQEKDMESRLLEIEYLEEEGARLEKEFLSLMKQQEDLERRALQAREEVKDLESRRHEETILLAREETEDARIKALLAGVKGEIEAHGAGVEEERVTLFVSMSRLTEIKNRLAEIERIKGEQQKRAERRRAEQERLQEKLVGLEDKHGTFKEVLKKERADEAQIALEEQTAQKEKEVLSRTVQEKRSSIGQLRGAKKGKEEFVKQMRSLQGVGEANPLNRKKLIDIVRVAEEAEKAVERFFFKEMEYYVLHEKDMTVVADTIKAHEGNYIFFPEKGMFRPNGHDDVAMEVKWISTIEDALLRIGQGEEGVFINDSVCIDSRGFVLREKEGKRVDLKSYRERVKAEKELREIAATLEEETAALKETEAQYFKSESLLRDLKGRKEGKGKRIIGLDREAIAVETELRTIRERLYELETKAELFEHIEDTEIAALLAEKVIQEKEKETIEARMTALKEQVESVKKVHDETLAKWHQATLVIERKKNLIVTLHEDMERKTALAGALGEDARQALEKRGEIEKERTLRATKQAALEQSYDELKKACERQIERYEALKISSGNIHMERHALQEKGEGLQKEQDRIRSRREGVEKELVVLLEKQDTIKERLVTIYAIEDPAAIAVPAAKDFDGERERITQAISSVGEVNFRAEKEYAELKERVTFLEQQKEDLKNAADSLRKTIAKIENVTKEIFLETFETVNKAFMRFTEMLFKGGKGYLVFNQETMGIDMFVQPPGKKVARMEQLSGGEKALICLSFLLALIDTKPSPFVLMDEIDAPLDDANLFSLMEIISDMSRKTQIVFVTHNRITMESSNTIYGVTMEEEGISKTIAVRL
ncbi:MAG: chromosome segregation protein SMC [Syntrophus sp. (in: bacteria)]|nr:chromosome segregation protein SMC [Syntrophus sp. (in: bacteria)]